jgi:hypothetical protein
LSGLRCGLVNGRQRRHFVVVQRGARRLHRDNPRTQHLAVRAEWSPALLQRDLERADHLVQ